MSWIDLKTRVAVVAGGAQGIGDAVSLRLLQPGASAVMCGDSEQLMASGKQRQGHISLRMTTFGEQFNALRIQK
jgi:NAD(P)-dependent dehydrogenase (short-subunit alcohol dehydrogenase family)